MGRRLPPLNALRAFEAAARHRSFTLAAQELLVTQGAISRHVSSLQDWLGIKLFVRTARGIELTSKGTSYATMLREVLDGIEDGTRRLQRGTDETTLRLKLPPTFAIRWLVPRLARFHALNREIDVQITTSHQKVDFYREDVDACIQWRENPNPGGRYQRLFGETLLPVCSPRFLKRCGRIRRPEDLARHALLYSLHRPSDWPTWFKAAGVADVDLNNGLKFENSALVYQAAIDELGIAVAQQAFVEDDLRTERLVSAFDLKVPTENIYYFGYAPESAKVRKVKAFEDWIMREVS